jgi:hypothetical protein
MEHLLAFWALTILLSPIVIAPHIYYRARFKNWTISHTLRVYLIEYAIYVYAFGWIVFLYMLVTEIKVWSK